MSQDTCGIDRNCAWRAQTRLNLPPGSICIALDPGGEPCGARATVKFATRQIKGTSDITQVGQPFCDYHGKELVHHVSLLIAKQRAFTEVKDEQTEKLRLAEQQAEKDRLARETAAKERKRRDRPADRVYFAKRGDRIKIGHSITPHKRLTDLANAAGAPFDAVVIARGGWKAEQRYHKRFASDRGKGEWFTFTDDIAREMAVLANQPDSVVFEKATSSNSLLA